MKTANIVLTGFMGTGKSTVGRILAVKLGYQFHDTDQFIELQENKTISRIFAEDGEQAFRNMEHALVKTLFRKKSQVIATGGGLMLNPENREMLSQNAYVFCLTASADVIIKRLLEVDDQQQRPLLKSDNPEAQIIRLMQERATIYNQFTNIQTDNKKPERIAEEILALTGATKLS